MCMGGEDSFRTWHWILTRGIEGNARKGFMEKVPLYPSLRLSKWRPSYRAPPNLVFPQPPQAR